MDLIRWNPAREMFTLRNRMNDLFDDFFAPVARKNDDASFWNWNPAVDIYENDDNIVIKAELPGIDKKDLAVDVKDQRLTIKGERKTENEVKEDNYYRRERTYGRFERSFTLPADVDADKVKADYTDGVLKVEIPKPAKQKPKKITVH